MPPPRPRDEAWWPTQALSMEHGGLYASATTGERGKGGAACVRLGVKGAAIGDVLELGFAKWARVDRLDLAQLT
jgi:hypothetical protein